MTEPTYTIWIRTGDEPLGGTDSNVYVMLFGDDGQTDWVFLPPRDAFAFEEGSVDKFVLDALLRRSRQQRRPRLVRRRRARSP